MGSSSSLRTFWGRVNALDRLAEVSGAKFAGDTPAKQLRRKAEAIVFPERFNRSYLPHYFRDEGCPAHQLVYAALRWETRMVARLPRGHAKSTIATFAYPLHQVVCAPVLKAWKGGTLEAADPALYAEIRKVMAEYLEGPPALTMEGLPAHHDPVVDLQMQAWIDGLLEQQRAAEELPLHWDPYIQIVAVDDATAIEFTSAIRAELERNDLLRYDWGELTPCYSGDWTRSVRRAASDSDFESNGVRVRAYGMQEAIRGGKHGEWRPTLAIFDDPDSEETSRTLKQRDANLAKLTKAANYGLEPMIGRILVLGTPHHPDCLVCRLSEQDQYKARWASIRFRAMDEAGRVLYPAKWSVDALGVERQEDPEAYQSELGDEPPAQADRPFHTIHRFARSDYANTKLPVILAFDPSLGKRSTSDFQALVELRGPTKDDLILVWRAWLLRIADPAALTARVDDIYTEVQPDVAVIEAIGFQALLETLLSSKGRHSGSFASWVKIEQQRDSKDLRVRGTAPLVNSGTLRFPDDGSTKQLESQYLAWGDAGSKRDGPDVVEMGLRQIRAPRRKRADIRHHPRERAHIDPPARAPHQTKQESRRSRQRRW